MKKNNEQGFGLIELLIAMAITSIAAGVIYSVFQSSVGSSVVQNTAAGVQQSARAALNLIAQDIRMAGYDPGNTGNAGIQVNQTEIRITSDRNADGTIGNSPYEVVTYRLDGNILRQGLNDTNFHQVIVGVTELEFTRGANWVDIILTVQENPGSAGDPIARTLETRVFLRNL